MPNVMAALPNTGQVALSAERRKAWLTTTARVPCSNAANIGESKIWTQSDFCTCQNSVGARSPANVYIAYQPRRRPNIVQRLVDLR